MNTIDGINIDDFPNRSTVEELQNNNCEDISTEKGVYLIFRENKTTPSFNQISTGGWFKGKDPNYPIETIEKKWVEGAAILYIGKAGGKRGLRQRIKQYVDFGRGRPKPHRGGRLIWHIENNKKLKILWKKVSTADPREIEKELLNGFIEKYSVLPFANMNK